MYIEKRERKTDRKKRREERYGENIKRGGMEGERKRGDGKREEEWKKLKYRSGEKQRRGHRGVH